MPVYLRRWLHRPPDRRVMAGLLALVLVAAQALAMRHELSHLLGDLPARSVVAGASAAPRAPDPGGMSAGHECALCLVAAAALGGVAPAPPQFTVAGAGPSVVAPCGSSPSLAARPLRAYASRAPPGHTAQG